MFKFICVFLLVQLAILARYLVYGAFEPLYYASTYLFLLAAGVLFFLSKHWAKKEVLYSPKDISSWSFLNRQRVFNNPKPLFKGDVQRGTIQRLFQQKWHYIIADLFGPVFFLSLKLTIDEDIIKLIPTKGKWFSNQSYWTITKNGQEIGCAKTVVDLKNTALLKEVIEMQIGEEYYSTTANTVTSHIILLHNDQQVGEMKRNHIISNVNIIDCPDESPEKILALLIHAFHFKNA